MNREKKRWSCKCAHTPPPPTQRVSKTQMDLWGPQSNVLSHWLFFFHRIGWGYGGWGGEFAFKYDKPKSSAVKAYFFQPRARVKVTVSNIASSYASFRLVIFAWLWFSPQSWSKALHFGKGKNNWPFLTAFHLQSSFCLCIKLLIGLHA